MTSLQRKIDQHASALEMLRTSQMGPYQFPIAAEFSNWREEQRAWREGVALMDQSFHMTDLYVEGPDAVPFIASLAINGFSGFGDGKAKQLVCCAPNGYVIGDMVLMGLGEALLNVIGRPTVASWIEFNASLGKFDVTCRRDERKLDSDRPKKTFRFEVQGPQAWDLLEDLNGGPLETSGFFRMGHISVGGETYRTLRHGMGGAPGLEFWGPVEHYDRVKGLLLEAGTKYDLRQVGARAYGSATVESGWWGCVFPAIYSDEAMRAYREWLPAFSFDGLASLGGSFASSRIEDYYFTPWDLDYGRLIRFDHDFIGREALEKMKDSPHRRKVSLVIDPADATAVYSSQMGNGPKGKAMEEPSAHYAAYPFDAVSTRDGQAVGVSCYLNFIAPDRTWVALACVDEGMAAEGTELSLLWGEPDGGSHRPTVERHVQMPLRGTVTSWPFSKSARAGYRAV
ncbi:aminomethyltransferase family protein [Oceanicola sp. S124]|uniref:aminomethyltransferase family protein n=1 Tax=Oceanicola sp. S124 TaxID=1042378 RepID=UPI0002558265|nr:aminomethyltransferase family protein [Oceanicola sp. S124]